MQRKLWSSIAVLTLAAGLSFGAGPAQATFFPETELLVTGFSGGCTVRSGGTPITVGGDTADVVIDFSGNSCVVDYSFNTFATGNGPFGFSYTKLAFNFTDSSIHLFDFDLVSLSGGGEVYVNFNDAGSVMGDFSLIALSPESLRFKANADDLMPGSYTIFEFVLYSSVSAGTFSVGHTLRVPEPGSLALLAIALAGLGFFMTRRRRVV